MKIMRILWADGSVTENEVLSVKRDADFNNLTKVVYADGSVEHITGLESENIIKISVREK